MDFHRPMKFPHGGCPPLSPSLSQAPSPFPTPQGIPDEIKDLVDPCVVGNEAAALHMRGLTALAAAPVLTDDLALAILSGGVSFTGDDALRFVRALHCCDFVHHRN